MRRGGVRTVSKSDGYFVLYPLYFDGRATREQGRRVPANTASPSPEAKDLYAAAKAAGLEPVLEDEKPHPSRWFERAGRVLVPRSAVDSKGQAIAAISEKLPAVLRAKAAATARGGKGGQPGAAGGPKKHRRRRHR